MASELFPVSMAQYVSLRDTEFEELGSRKYK